MKKQMIIAVAILMAVAGTTADAQTSEQSHSRINSGVGFGIPYGVLGANLDLDLGAGFKGSFGLGSTIVAGPGFSAGVKYFLGGPDRGFRPRCGVFYGTNAIIQRSAGIVDAYESYNGLNLVFGSEVMFGSSRKHGLDFDLVYIATNGYDDDDLGGVESEPGRVKFSLGYRRAL